MRIGIDASTWTNERGFGRFTRELVSAMARSPRGHRLVLLCDSLPGPALDAQIVFVRQKTIVSQAAVTNSSRPPLDLLRFTAAAAGARLDALFYPAVYSWFPCPPRLPNVVTLHDAIAEHFPSMVFRRARDRRFWNVKVRLACLQADRFLTVSNAAKAEIVRYLRLDAARIDLTTEGPKPDFKPLGSADEVDAARNAIARRCELPEGARYFSYVGGFAPHKNVGALLAAFAQLDQASFSDVHLLLVGDRASQGFTSNMEDLVRAIDTSAFLSRRVHFTGFVDDAVLARIYATSIALVMPSLAEGFGLPAIEAMACATPVVASRGGSLQEVVGDAGLLVDPASPADIAAAMQRLATDTPLADGLRARSVERARRFSWDDAAELAFACIERCVREASA